MTSPIENGNPPALTINKKQENSKKFIKVVTRAEGAIFSHLGKVWSFGLHDSTRNKIAKSANFSPLTETSSLLTFPLFMALISGRKPQSIV